MNRAHQIVGPVLLRRRMLQQTPFSMQCESLAEGEGASRVAPRIYQLGTPHGTHNLRAGYLLVHASQPYTLRPLSSSRTVRIN